MCAFGCGSRDQGEWSAARKLFRGVEDVCTQDQDQGLVDEESEKEKEELGVDLGLELGLDGTSDVAQEMAGKSRFTSTWAGRRLVTDWGAFLRGCEREGVAPL